jgi:hypothetical protein
VSQRYTARPDGTPVVQIDATSGNETHTLTAGFTPGRQYVVERVDGSANTVTVSAEGGDTLNGTANGSITIPPRESVTLDRLDAAWRTVGFGGAEQGTTTNPATGSDDWLKAWAATVADNGAVGAITVDGDGVATSFTARWPDGTSGTFTATTINATWLTVDAWTLTYQGATTKTVTQPAVTRDPTTGAVTDQPALTVA